MEDGAVTVPGSGRHSGTPAATAASQEEAARQARLISLAVIGNRLRTPVACCEAGACGARYDDPAALGEADVRSRAIAAGWREDLTGLLTCPGCQRRAPWPDAFRPAPPGAARSHHAAPQERPRTPAEGRPPATAYPPAPPAPPGYPSAPPGYPPAAQGFPSAPPGYPPAPQGFPSAAPAPQGFPSAAPGYPPAPQGDPPVPVAPPPAAPPPAGPPYPART